MVRCPACGTLVSEWAASCPRCGAGVVEEPLVDRPAVAEPRAEPRVEPRAEPRAEPLAERTLRPGERSGAAHQRRLPRRLFAVWCLTAVLVVANLAAIPVIESRRPSRPRPALRPFVPPVRRDGSAVVLPVTLLDGRQLQLRYPPELALAQLGLTLAAEIAWPVRDAASGCCWVRLSASQATLAGAYGHERPLATFRGAGDGRVPLVSSAERRLPPGFAGPRNLVFQVDRWLLEVDTSPMGASGVPGPMTAGELRALAMGLEASVESGGYVVVRPRPPIAFATRALMSSRSAVFGLGSPNEPQGNTLDIEDGYCDQPSPRSASRSRFETGDGLQGVSWCELPAGLLITAIGRRRFVDLVATQLAVTLVTAGHGSRNAESKAPSGPAPGMPSSGATQG